MLVLLAGLVTSPLVRCTVWFHALQQEVSVLLAPRELALLDLYLGHRVLHLCHVGLRYHAGPDVACLRQLGFLEYSFIETVDAMYPFYVMRAFGGLLFLAGAIIMAYNLVMTVRVGEEVESEAAGQPALAPAE